jgi:hypothetical protein
MSDVVSFVQEAGRRSQTLRFEPDRLVLAFADDRSARELSLAYYDIDVGRARTSEVSRARWPIYAGLIFTLAAALPVAPPPLRALLAGLALVCAAVALGRRSEGGATRYALLAPRRRQEILEIWPDAQHDRIVAEMAARWRAMRRRAVRVDFHADPAGEIARFQALRARRVIDAEECAAAIARIAARGAAREQAQ